MEPPQPLPPLPTATAVTLTAPVAVPEAAPSSAQVAPVSASLTPATVDDGGRGRGAAEHERRGELYQERDEERSMHSKGVTNTTTDEGGCAVVFKTRFLCECRLQRVLALSQISQLKFDVWILHDEPMGQEIAKQVNDLAASNGRVFVAMTSLIDLDRYPPFPHSERKDLIWPFVNWLHQSKYAFAWYVEDDFVFTGDWSSYFGPAEQKAGRADLVAQYRNTDASWVWSGSCELRGRKCIENNHIIQTKLALNRMSRRFAARMLHLRALRQLKGRDEALVALICDEWVECTRSPLYFRDGVYQPGHWGPFQSNSYSRSYTLRGLASFNSKTKRFNFSEYPTNADVPRDSLYHPVKCEAERQWEGKWLVDKTAPVLSLLAPAEGPKTTTKKDPTHGDLRETKTAWHLKKSVSLYEERPSTALDRRRQGQSEKGVRGALQEENVLSLHDSLFTGDRERERERSGHWIDQFKESALRYKESLREK